MSRNEKTEKKEGNQAGQASPQKDIVTLSREEFAKLESEVKKAQEYWDRLLRLQAEFDNAKKRMERERLEFIKYANEGVISEFLTILDDLERTLELAQHNREDFGAFLKGVEMILSHLYEMLKKNGVSVIESEGKLFNPNLHEALMREETDGIAENTVVEELQKGYMINGRVLRTAKVKVATSKSTDNKGKGESSE